MQTPNDIIGAVADFLMARNVALSRIYYLASQIDDGTILLPKGVNEYDRTGLDDRKGNYGYIRYHNPGGESWSMTPSTVKSPSSCIRVMDVVQNLRLVTVTEGSDPQDIFADKLVNDLLGFSMPDKTGYKAVQCQPVAVLLEPFQIFAEETGREKRGFPLRMQFVAIDFQLLYQYYFDSCKRWTNSTTPNKPFI